MPLGTLRLYRTPWNKKYAETIVFFLTGGTVFTFRGQEAPFSVHRLEGCLVSNVCNVHGLGRLPARSIRQSVVLPASLTSPIYVLLVRTSSEFSACTLLCAVPVSLSVCVLSNYMCPVWPFCAALLVHTYTWLDFCLPAPPP